MPAKRLPWFRFWIGGTANGKVRQLDDGTFRTWVELLDAAAMQPKRGRFESRAEAVAITRRPAQHVDKLIAARLIDETDAGLVMHDWDEWQRWRDDDNDTHAPEEPPPDPPSIDARRTRDQHTNNSRTSRERLVNVSASTSDERTNDSPSTHDEHANDPPLRVSAEGDTDTDTERELIPPVYPPLGGRQAGETAKRPKRADREGITPSDIAALVEKYAPRYGGRQAVRDEIDSALNHTARYKALSERGYVDTWLRRELGLRPVGLQVVRPEPAGHLVDRTGVAN